MQCVTVPEAAKPGLKQIDHSCIPGVVLKREVELLIHSFNWW